MSKRDYLILYLVIIIIAAVGFTFSRLSKKDDQSKNSEPVITYSTATPDESKKNADNYTWKGTADEPKKIRIDSLAVDAFVQKAGVDQNNQVAVPNNVHLASWFANSVKPGNLGLAIIDGHVSGKTTDGVFKNLKKLTKDQTFSIELGSGKTLQYKVLETVELKESEAANYLFSQKPTVKSQLNLITCGGNFNRAANQYENRIIVAAELVN